jgi:hypothetical protein
MTESMPAPFPPQEAPSLQEPLNGRMPPPLPPRARRSNSESNNEELPFSRQPRHIKALTVLFFPVYAIPRVGLKLVEEISKQTFQLARSIWSLSCKVYCNCETVYKKLAPIIWQGVILPFFVHPLREYVITPILWFLRNLYDFCERLATKTALSVAQAYRCLANKMTKKE